VLPYVETTDTSN